MSFIGENLLYLLQASAILTVPIYFNFFTILCDLRLSRNWHTEVWKSQRDVLMLLSLVLHYHSKKLLFLKGSHCLNNILDQIESKKEKFVLLTLQHTLKFDSFPFYLTISSKEFFCLVPIWPWAFM